MNTFVVKIDFHGDIRRFTQEEASLSLEGLLETVSKAFQLNRSEASLFYPNEKGGQVEIGSSSQLQNVLLLLKNKNSNVLRIVVQKRSNQHQYTAPKPVAIPDLTASSINPLTTSTISGPPPPNPAFTPLPLPVPESPPPVSVPTPTPITITIPALAPNESKNMTSTPNNNNNNNHTNIGSSETVAERSSSSTPKQASESTVPPSVQEIISHPLFQQKLKENVTRTVFSAPFINLLSQALLPSIQVLIDESVKNQLELSLKNVKSSHNNTNNDAVKVEPIPPKSEEKPQEGAGKEKEKVVQPEPEKETEKEMDVSEPDNFVMVDKNQVPPEESENAVNGSSKSPKAAVFIQNLLEVLSGKKSLLSLQNNNNNKSSNSKENGQPEGENEKMEPIPNLDEILRQLGEMGFTDKEMNMKVLQFHKKYNEGLDEVVEDLLMQSTTNENAKPVQQ